MPYCQSAHVLRGLAALAVAWFSFTNGQPLFLEKDSLLRLSGAYGYLGAAVFFAISGFVIPYSLDRMGFQFPQDIPKFIKRRFWRIYPTYVVAATITVALLYASYVVPFSHSVAPTLDARTIIGHLTFTVPWFGAEWYSPIYWFLAIEIQFYLAFAVVAPAFLSQQKIILLAALFVVACLSFVSSDRRLVFWYLPTFGIGISWFLLYTKRLSAIDASSQALGFSIIAYMTMGLDYALAALLSFAALAVPIRKPIPVLAFLGTISYSLYLLHSPIGGRVINLAVRLPLNLPIQIAALVIAMALSIAVSYLMWRFVERKSAKHEGKGATGARLSERQAVCPGP